MDKGIDRRGGISGSKGGSGQIVSSQENRETSNTVAKTTYAYDAVTLVLNTETVFYDIDGDSTYELTRVIDRHQDNLLRPTGFDLKDGATVETQASYTYDTARRLGTVTDGTDTFTYGYQPDSYGLVKTVTGPAHTVTNSWETTRNVLASKENKAGSTVVSDFAYTVNSIGQRSDVSQTGTAFAATRSITWGYDALGQVVSADSTIAGLDRSYLYDTIGNRVKSADSLTLPPTANYTANALNQYTAVDSLTPSYDDDGNATAYPLPAHLSANSTLVWDAENRLISATVNSVTTTYRYDSGGRRIATVATGGAATLVIYDGWNPIAKYSGTTLDETYTWGMDISGSMQGAGGVGGLLLITDHSALANFFPTYDGNGNVSEYLDSTGTVQAHYEYDPFGRTTVATGTKAQDFSHRFSTKPLDAETGLYYYGYRYYDPVTGRWPSRDPIEERGGINLYGFLENDGVNGWDVLGLKKEKCDCAGDVGNFKDISISGSIVTLAGNNYDFTDPKGWAKKVVKLHVDGAKQKASKKFSDTFKKAGTSFGNLTKALSVISLIREVQAGFYVNEFSVEASMKCCQKNKEGEYAWEDVSGSGFADVGGSLKTEYGRGLMVSGMKTAMTDAAGDLLSDCPKSPSSSSSSSSP